MCSFHFSVELEALFGETIEEYSENKSISYEEEKKGLVEVKIPTTVGSCSNQFIN